MYLDWSYRGLLKSTDGNGGFPSTLLLRGEAISQAVL